MTGLEGLPAAVIGGRICLLASASDYRDGFWLTGLVTISSLIFCGFTNKSIAFPLLIMLCTSRVEDYIISTSTTVVPLGMLADFVPVSAVVE